MAAADKTYINKEQYKLVKQWWLKTRKKQKRELGAEIWMYPFQWLSHETYDNGYDKPPVVHYSYDPSESNIDVENMGDDSPVWNTSTKQNFWIAKNCPFDFIQVQIRDKLSEEFYQEIPDELSPISLIDKMSFDEKDCVLQITSKRVKLYFWEDGDNKDEIKVIDKMLLYGTTYIFKIIEDFKKIPFSNNFNHTVIFTYCGLNFKYSRGKTYYIDGKKLKEVYIPFFKFGELKFPKFKYTFDKSICENWPPNQVILSLEKDVHDMAIYKEGSTNKRLLHQLPNYIYNQLT